MSYARGEYCVVVVIIRAAAIVGATSESEHEENKGETNGET